MLKKEDKDGIIEYLKAALADVKTLVDDVTLDPELTKTGSPRSPPFRE